MREFIRAPFPIIDDSESAGIRKMLLLHHQAVMVRIGGEIGGIVNWTDVLNIRKAKKRTNHR